MKQYLSLKNEDACGKIGKNMFLIAIKIPTLKTPSFSKNARIVIASGPIHVIQIEYLKNQKTGFLKKN